MTPIGLCEFKTVPFGLQGAGAMIQQMVENVLRIAEDYSGAYMDNIRVSSMTWQEHLAHLRDFFRNCRKLD